MATQENSVPESAKVPGTDADRDSNAVARELHWLEKLNIVGQLSLVAVGIIAASIYGCQLRTMNGQLEEMKGSGTQTSQLLSLYQQQLTELKKQAADTHDLATATGKQADAAKALANLTAKQVVANQELVESQRAAIIVSFGRVINPISFRDGSPSIVFSILLQNSGSIKATHVAVRFKPYYSLMGNNTFTEPLQKQRDYCATDVQPNENWGWDENGKRIDLKGLRDFTITLEPHTAVERQLNFGMGKPTDAEIIKWPPSDTIQRNPTLAVTDRVFPIVVGCVDYQSGVMAEKHQTGFIFEVHEAYPATTGGNPAPTLVHYGVDVPREMVVITQFFFGQGKQY